MVVRRAKIVCTLGPATASNAGVRGLIAAGMDVARLNFSHGTHPEHARVAELVRSESAAVGKPVAVLQDLSGPKIRTGRGSPASVASGERITLIEGETGDPSTIAIGYEGLAADLHPEDSVQLDDGRVRLRVVEIAGGRVECVVEQGAPLRDRMGVNLPSRRVRLRALTDKDRADLAFGLSLGVDYVALSFVKSAADIRELRDLCRSLGRAAPPVVAKIETPEAVENLVEIIRAADAVMVARGDLGVELRPERVPIVQREIIGVARLHQRPVIVATEMLQSMVESTRPTRAEAGDVATAVFQGADAVMLSAETASGRYPHEACAMMERIILEAEGSKFYAPQSSDPGQTVQEAIAHAACVVAKEVGAKVIVAFTVSGGTPRLVSKARPIVPIVAFSPSAEALRRLALYWGVMPRPLPVFLNTDALASAVIAHLREQEIVSSGDRFVMAYGSPVGQRSPTNSIRVVEIG
ncbi:MAG: pyruvate kinase [Bacteroidota bacterium]